jgi:hypothetical protein
VDEIDRGDIDVAVRTALKTAKGLGMILADLFTELERDREGTRAGDRRARAVDSGAMTERKDRAATLT